MFVVRGLSLAVVLEGDPAVNYGLRVSEDGGKEVPHYGIILCGGSLI